MSLVLASPEAAAATSRPVVSFRVCRSQAGPLYHQLSLQDDQGDRAHWIVPVPLKQLAKSPALLWQLPPTGALGALTCLDTGAMRLAPAHPGTRPDLRADLAEGTLRLHFEGQVLRGYFRLHCLPEGSGQLWQLIPIGHV